MKYPDNRLITLLEDGEFKVGVCHKHRVHIIKFNVKITKDELISLIIRMHYTHKKMFSCSRNPYRESSLTDYFTILKKYKNIEEFVLDYPEYMI